MTNSELIFLGYRLIEPMPTRAPKMPPIVREICSASQCVRGNPEGTVVSWDGFNDASLYSTVANAMKVMPGPVPEGCSVFAYRLLPALFWKGVRSGSFNFNEVFGCEKSAFPEAPKGGFASLGFDAVSIFLHTPATDQYAPRLAHLSHSPLSCNDLAGSYGVNQYCLFDGIDAAVAAAIRFSKEEPEPGPYVVVEVLRGVEDAT
ncbi:MAG: hypothetical protein ACREJO_14810 [Phycisphaerales bacterium]